MLELRDLMPWNFQRCQYFSLLLILVAILLEFWFDWIAKFTIFYWEYTATVVHSQIINKTQKYAVVRQRILINRNYLKFITQDIPDKKIHTNQIYWLDSLGSLFVVLFCLFCVVLLNFCFFLKAVFTVTLFLMGLPIFRDYMVLFDSILSSWFEMNARIFSNHR